MHILYVEDNETNQALVERVVRARRHQISFREDGEGALEILTQEPGIDLVLLDIELAGTMSGTEVVKALRERHDRRPVVAVTAYAMMGDRERMLEAGCDQYLPKPLNINDLLALFDQYEAKLAASAPAPAPETPNPDDAPAPVAAAPPVLPGPAPVDSPGAPHP
jgi:CheY-like chemotaxis protein